MHEIIIALVHQPVLLAIFHAADAFNPFEGVTPDFSFLGAKFTQLWQKVLAVVWAAAIVLAVISLIGSIRELGAAKKDPNKRHDAIQGIMVAGGAVAGLLCVAVVYVAIANLVQQ